MTVYHRLKGQSYAILISDLGSVIFCISLAIGIDLDAHQRCAMIRGKEYVAGRWQRWIVGAVQDVQIGVSERWLLD